MVIYSSPAMDEGAPVPVPPSCDATLYRLSVCTYDDRQVYSMSFEGLFLIFKCIRTVQSYGAGDSI